MGNLLETTFQVLFLGSPLLLAAVAQGLCIKYGWLDRLKRPIDLGLSFMGHRIFGDHKTWRGFLVNVASCTLGTAIQAWLQNGGCLPPWLPLLDYTRYCCLPGVLLGIGMTLGELPNSFLKRRLGIVPGGRGGGLLGIAFSLFDQVDLTIGMWVFLYLLIKPSLFFILWSLVVTIVVHLTVSAIGYLVGMRSTVL